MKFKKEEEVEEGVGGEGLRRGENLKSILKEQKLFYDLRPPPHPSNGKQI